MDESVLDRLAADHPQVPAVVRLKAALLFYGLQDSERQVKFLVEAGDWAFPNFMPHYLAPAFPAYRGMRQVPFPYLIRLADDTQVRLRLKSESPFVLRRLDGTDFPNFEEAQQNSDSMGAWSHQHQKSPKHTQVKGFPYALYEKDRYITTLSFEPKLAWSAALTADGTPFKATGLSQHGDMMVLNPAPGCEYFVAPFGHEKKNLSCQFCLYGLPDQRMKSLGQSLFKAELPTENLKRICEACAHPETNAKHLYLVSGSMVDMAEEGRRFVQLARSLNQAGLTERYYVACGSGAIPKSAMLEMKALGVKGACFNLEVWDPVQFKRVCPGKDKFVGRERWIEALEDAVEVFGEGHVMSAFVGGAELDGEGAFSDPDQALASNLAGAEFLLSKRIQPIYSLHWKMTGKNRGLEPIYTLDHFLKLNQGLAEARQRHQLAINPDFFCRRCAYMQLEPDYDYWIQQANEANA
ncbi:MAG: hypothetical protein CMH49_05570 [Myxococcales bacterium]|nr:hypothetical protein [Myxococcales bacterium]